MARIDEVHHARYRLQNVAVEMFLTDRRSAFLAFPDRRTAQEVAARISASRAGITLMDRRRKLEAGAYTRPLLSNLSAFCGIGGARRGCVARDQVELGGVQGV